MRIGPWVAIVAVGCGSGGDGEGGANVLPAEAEAPSESAIDQPDSSAAESTVVRMPALPVATSGRLSLRGAGTRDEYGFEGSWTVEGGRCAEAGLIHMVTHTPTFGALVLLALPAAMDSAAADTAAGDSLTLVAAHGERSYPVRSELEGVPDPSTARIGLYHIPDDRAYSFAGEGGTLEIDTLDATVSGTFQVYLRETTFRDSILVAGAFRDVRLPPVDSASCVLISTRRVLP